MIRRLHEIEPPKLALPSEKSNQSEDPTAKESLASEFKKLLERARGGISGARDEISALGFALSQAVSSVKQQQVEVQGPVRAEGADSEDAQGHVSDDEAVDCVTQDGGVIVKDAAQARNSGPVNTGPVDDDGGGEVEVENLGEGALTLDQGGDEIELEEEIVYAELDDLDLDTDLISDTQDLAVQVTSQHVMVSHMQTEVAETSGGELRIDKESGLERVDLSGEEEAEEEVWSDDFVGDDLTAQVGSEMARPQLSSKRLFSKGEESHSTGNEEMDRLLAQLEREDSGDNSFQDADFQTRSLGAETRLSADPERSVTGVRREAVTLNDMSLMSGATPSRERNGELSMQLSLLRQAYDSLKAQTSASVDSKSKAASPGITGVGAAAEPRAAKNDAAPRVAKYLNRATSQRMMERIETALKEAARSRDGKTITLRLDPMQLGQVKCDVSLRDGLLHARITPQNPELVSSVREHAHELQTALRRLGLNVDRVSVQVLSERDPGSFAQTQAFLDGKSFQQDGNNMPGKERQTPENTFGSEFADTPRSGIPDAGITPADHWIA